MYSDEQIIASLTKNNKERLAIFSAYILGWCEMLREDMAN